MNGAVRKVLYLNTICKDVTGSDGNPEVVPDDDVVEALPAEGSAESKVSITAQSDLN
jgi:hypothetical protein